ESFPTISFQSTKITSDGDDFKMTGDLTVRDVTKPVTFDVEFGGKAPMPDGNDVYVFEAETKINREEFGLTWNAVLEHVGVAVSKDVKINVEIEVKPALSVIKYNVLHLIERLGLSNNDERDRFIYRYLWMSHCCFLPG